MSRYIDADLLMQKWLFRGKSQAMYRDEIRSVPTADVVSKEKYDELNERYHRLLESAKILSDAVREYERRENE